MPMPEVWLSVISSGFRYVKWSWYSYISRLLCMQMRWSFSLKFSSSLDFGRTSKDSCGMKRRLTWSFRSIWRALSRTSRQCAKLMTAASGWELSPWGWTGLPVPLSWGVGKDKKYQKTVIPIQIFTKTLFGKAKKSLYLFTICIFFPINNSRKADSVEFLFQALFFALCNCIRN